MQLMTDELRRKLPPLFSCERGLTPTVYAKFHAPWCGWSWYAVEFDGTDLFLGVVKGPKFFEKGCFSLSQLESIRGPEGQRVERDPCFKPCSAEHVRPSRGSRASAGGRHG